MGFADRSLTSAESNYTTTQRECLAVVWAIQHFRVYLEGQEFQLLMDHNVLYLILKQTKSWGRIIPWVMFFSQFIYTVKHVKGRQNMVPDTLS